MKLRIKGNSIRFRLTISDVAAFYENRFIQEITTFGDHNFSYALKSSDTAKSITAEFINDGILVTIPAELATKWVQTNEVGMSEEIPFSDGKKLFVLIEKDFKCLDETSEDQSDNYANPLSEKQ